MENWQRNIYTDGKQAGKKYTDRVFEWKSDILIHCSRYVIGSYLANASSQSLSQYNSRHDLIVSISLSLSWYSHIIQCTCREQGCLERYSHDAVIQQLLTCTTQLTMHRAHCCTNKIGTSCSATPLHNSLHSRPIILCHVNHSDIITQTHAPHAVSATCIVKVQHHALVYKNWHSC